ncbi:hypothetical protein EJB05_33099 [Eragrostis curvula]|uniref:Uncharacterized protein n=1 Tax=Eragrostis curvula TaxID=38414 RepID=A0A5J9U0H5_9POAL|nr:hypothetical protein EJB05_33099 [Eragrostis curvula]
MPQIQGGAGLGGGRRASGLELDVVVNGVEAVRYESRKSRSSSSTRPRSVFMGADRDRPRRQHRRLRNLTTECFKYFGVEHLCEDSYMAAEFHDLGKRKFQKIYSTQVKVSIIII